MSIGGESRRRRPRRRVSTPQHLLHVCCKTIAPPRDGRDVTLITSGLAKSLTDHENRLRQVRLFHKAVGPDGSHQFVFRHQSPAAFDQKDKRVKNLGGKWNMLRIS